VIFIVPELDRSKFSVGAVEPPRTRGQVAGREHWIIVLAPSAITLISWWVPITRTCYSRITRPSIALTGWDSSWIWCSSSIALCWRGTSISCWSSCRITLARGSSSISSHLWISLAWLRLGRVSQTRLRLGRISCTRLLLGRISCTRLLLGRISRTCLEL